MSRNNAQSMNLDLNKFDMRNIKFTLEGGTAKGPVIVFIGRRETGKSYLVNDLLFYHHQNIPVGTIISGTEAANSFYGSLVPKILIHEEYSTRLIENIMSRQRKIFKTIKSEQRAYGRSELDPRTIALLDDCLWDDKWTRDKMMRGIFMNGRHWGIMLLITMQYPLGIPPALRTNVDYVFILREPNASNRRRIYENYASCFPSFETFCQVMDQCTQNYECLVINCNAKTNNLQDMVFWYKAESHPKFRMFSQKYWDMSRNIGSDDENEENNNYDESRVRTRNTGPRITVRKSSGW